MFDIIENMGAFMSFSLSQIIESIPSILSDYMLLIAFIGSILSIFMFFKSLKNHNKYITYSFGLLSIVLLISITYNLFLNKLSFEYILSSLKIKQTSNYQSDVIISSEKRFDIYNEKEISIVISNLNKDLARTFLTIDPALLKKFIFAMNGDYSLISRDEFLDVHNVLINIDNSMITLVNSYRYENGIYLKDDYSWSKLTSISSFPEIFVNKVDYEFSKYMLDEFTKLKELIYLNEDPRKIIEEIDKFAVFVDSVYRYTPILLPTGDSISINETSKEADYFTLNCILSQIDYLITSPNYGSRDEIIKYNDSVDISVIELSNNIKNLESTLFNSVIENIK